MCEERGMGRQKRLSSVIGCWSGGEGGGFVAT
jgi:hypothetical protein